MAINLQDERRKEKETKVNIIKYNIIYIERKKIREKEKIGEEL